MRETKEPGMALVLVDRSKEVDAFYDANTSNLRTLHEPAQRLVGEGIRRGRAAGARADLGQSRIKSSVSGRIER
jgi:hypothetical protein